MDTELMVRESVQLLRKHDPNASDERAEEFAAELAALLADLGITTRVHTGAAWKSVPIAATRYTLNLEPMSTNRANMIVMLPVKGKPWKKRPTIMKTKAARAWMETAVYQLKKQKKGAGASMIEGPCEVWVQIWRKARIGDVDNFAKGVLDALQKSEIVRDDKQVLDLYMFKRVDKGNPRYDIAVMEQATQGDLFGAGQEPEQSEPDEIPLEEELA